MIKGIAIGVVGAIAIFASAGAATPLVAGALFVTGSCAYAYGASNFCEGLEDYEYGKAGDLTSYAFNPIRDTVFMGNQQLYDLWGNVNVMAAGFLTMGAGAYAEGVASGYTGFELTKSVSIAVAKETVVGFLGDKATEATVSMLDQHFNLNMTEEALLEIGLSVAFDPGTYETAHSFYNKATGKLHPDIHTDISDVAGQTLLPDSELNFADMMSPEDAARYNQWSADCANGTHNNFPGLKDADVAAWKFGDVKLNDASVMAGIDGDAVLALRGENVRVETHLKNEFDDLDISTATTKQKGNYGEYKANDNLINNQSLKDAGYDLESIGRDAPNTPNDKIQKGIDGLYKNNNPNSNIKYVIDEAKFGKSSLSETKDGTQMSDDWLTGAKTKNDRILKAVNGDRKLAYAIEDALENGAVERVLSHVDDAGNVTTYKLNADGEIIGNWP